MTLSVLMLSFHSVAWACALPRSYRTLKKSDSGSITIGHRDVWCRSLLRRQQQPSGIRWIVHAHAMTVRTAEDAKLDVIPARHIGHASR